MSKSIKAGPVTLAVALILIGFILLVGNVIGGGIVLTALKYWPVLLIGLGAEYFIRTYSNKKKYGTDEVQTKFSLAIIVFILVVSLLGYTGQKAAEILWNQDIKSVVTEMFAGERFSYTNEFRSKAIDVKPGLSTINLEDLDGRIDLVPSADGKFHVEADITGWGPSQSEAQRRTEMFKINIKEGPVINVYSGKTQVSNSKRSLEVVYRFMIPKGISITVDNQRLIRADNIEANLKIRLSNGDVVLRNIKGNVAFEGDAAQVTLDGIAGSVESTLSSGKLFLKNVSGNVHVDSDDSNIEIINSMPINSNFSIKSLNGYIVLKVPESSNALIKAETVKGKLRGSLKYKYEAGRPDRAAGNGEFSQPGQQNQDGLPANQPNQDSQQNQSEEQVRGGSATAVLGSGKGIINLTTETGNIVIDKY